MTTVASSRLRPKPKPRSGVSSLIKRPWSVIRFWPLVLASGGAAGAVLLVAYLLWPTWSADQPSSEPDHLPVMVGGVLFNVPQNAIRVKIQRRSGVQERIDLSFLYPSLTPPAAPVHVTAASIEDAPMTTDRIFVTIAAHNGAMAPLERARTIYPRYLDAFSRSNSDGLARQGFRTDSPYNGEDMFIGNAGQFLARCTRDAATPGMCLSERRIEGADLTFRFPREWTGQWRDVAGAMDQLTAHIVRRR